MIRTLPGLFHERRVGGWPICRHGSRGKTSGGLSMPSTGRRRRAGATARFCSCWPPPAFATRNCDRSNLRIFGGALPRFSCDKARRGAIGLCRSCRRRAKRLPITFSMPDPGSIAGGFSSALCRPLGHSGPVPLSQGSCDRDWRSEESSFPAGPAPIWCAIAWQRNWSANDVPSMKSRTCLAIGAWTPPPSM